MFCESCGHGNADGVRFCSKCGTPLQAAPAADTGANYGANSGANYRANTGANYRANSGANYGANPGTNYGTNSGANYGTNPGANYGTNPGANPGTNYGRPAVSSYAAPASSAKLRSMLPVAALGVIAAIVLILLFTSLGGPKALAKKALKRTTNGRVTSYIKLYHKDYLEENDMLDDDALENYKEREEDWQDALEEFEDEEGGRLRLSYKIKDIDKIKGDDLDDMQDFYEDEYDLKIKAAKRYEMEVNARWDDEEEEYDADVIVVKIGGKWYLYSCGNPISGLLSPYLY